MTDNIQAGIEFSPTFVPDALIEIPLKAVQTKPALPTIPTYTAYNKKQLIVNVETLGLRPWEHRISAIGFLDPLVPNDQPTIIMLDDEAEMIRIFLKYYKANSYNELVGYGFTFDLRFLLLRSMYYGLPAKELINSSVFDIMEPMQNGKNAFMWRSQDAPSLSDLADFLFSYPKALPDTEIIKRYLTGDLETVKQFASDQVYRTLLVYFTYLNTAESEII